MLAPLAYSWGPHPPGHRPAAVRVCQEPGHTAGDELGCNALESSLNHPPTPDPCLWENCLPRTGPWCQKAWGPLADSVRGPAAPERAGISYTHTPRLPSSSSVGPAASGTICCPGLLWLAQVYCREAALAPASLLCWIGGSVLPSFLHLFIYSKMIIKHMLSAGHTSGSLLMLLFNALGNRKWRPCCSYCPDEKSEAPGGGNQK